MKLFEKVAKIKVYFIRALSYLSILNFMMIFATFKKAYNIPISSYIIIPFGVLCALIVGYLDYKLVLGYETEHNNKQNNVKLQLDRMEILLGKLDENGKRKQN